MKQKFNHSASSGFTLVELLVVIVIIVSIAAISLIGMRRMRDLADKTGAIRGLSQLQLANASYSTDNGGKYVPYLITDESGTRIGWWYQVPEFLNYFRGPVTGADGQPSKSVPLSMLDPKVVRAKKPFFSSMAGSFGLNQTGLPTSSSAPNSRPSHTVATVTKPEQSMAFASATDVRVNYAARFSWFAREPDKREGKTSDGGLAYRHGNKAIAVYFDGHVEELSKPDLEKIDKTRGGTTGAFWTPIQQ
jgi:prepilin-type N-terminal cleavage/methylation domain-containing protein/prepilin-type processing-associated H-X9-DG protein